MDCSPPGSSVHGILRQEYWGGFPFPPPGDLPNTGMELVSPEMARRFFTSYLGSPRKGTLPLKFLRGRPETGSKKKSLKQRF